MRRNTFRWLMGGLATILAVVVSPPVVEGGYTPPSQSNSLLGEVFEFVGDFGGWNASLNNLPLQILASTPAPEQLQVFIALFRLWLQDLGTGSGGNASSPQGSSPLAGLLPPPSSGAPVGSPTGSIVMGQSGYDPPALPSTSGSGPPPVPSNGGGGDPPTLLSNGGSDPLSPLPQGGGDPPAIGSNGGSSSLLSDPPSTIGGGSSFSSDPPSTIGGGSAGQHFDSDPPLGGSTGGSGKSPLTPDADPAPVPASFMLLAVGAAGLLAGRWMRRRRLA